MSTLQTMSKDLKPLQEWVPTLSAQQLLDNSALLRAISSLSAAALETRKILARYRSNGKKLMRGDPNLVDLWRSASLSLVTVDNVLAQRCLSKAHYWADPTHWTSINNNESSIDLDNIFNDSLKLLDMAASTQSKDKETIQGQTSFHNDKFTEKDLQQVTIGVLTALPKEYSAVKAVLKNGNEVIRSGKGAGRRYWITRVPSLHGHSHIVAVAQLVSMGNNIGSARATQFLEHCPNLRALLMVGIAGGIPHPDNAEDHVRLGDIVVSNEKGVIQYDFIKRTEIFEERRHMPRPPGAELLEAVNALHSEELEGGTPWETYIAAAVGLLGWVRPNASSDVLKSIGRRKTIEHPIDYERREDQPRIFRGPIASANTLLKDPKLRNQLRDTYSVKAVEMEASGIADAAWLQERGYLVVRGICDYCDKSKNNLWQKYASIVAAAYSRSIIENLPAHNVNLQSLPAVHSDSDAERLHDLVHEMDTRRVFYEVEENIDYAIKSVIDARTEMRKISRGLWRDHTAETLSGELQRILSEFVSDAEAIRIKYDAYEHFYARLEVMRDEVMLVVGKMVALYGRHIQPRNIPLKNTWNRAKK